MHPTYNSLHPLTPNSHSIPPPPQKPQVCSPRLWICFCFIDQLICVIVEIPHTRDIIHYLYDFVWLHLVRWTLGSPMLLPMALCCSFLCLNTTPLYINTTSAFHSSVSDYLDCLCVLAIVNSAAMNTGEHASFWSVVFFRYMPRSGIAGSYGISICIFWGTSIVFCIVAELVYIPTNSVEGFLFLPQSPAFVTQFSSVTQSCRTLCNPMNPSTPGLPVHHQLPEFTQTHVHRVGDAIQPSHPLSSPSPPAPNPSQHQSLFQWVNSLHEVAKVLEFQPQHQSFQWTPGLIPFRMDWLDLLASKGLSRVFSKTTVQKHQFFGTQPSSQSNSHIHTWPQEKP